MKCPLRVFKAIKQMKIPKSKTENSNFLGLCGYYRKFIKNFSILAFPLLQLTHDNVIYKWDKEHQVAFEVLEA
jgi:hypothetical protein